MPVLGLGDSEGVHQEGVLVTPPRPTPADGAHSLAPAPPLPLTPGALPAATDEKQLLRLRKRMLEQQASFPNPLTLYHFFDASGVPRGPREIAKATAASGPTPARRYLAAGLEEV